MAANNNNISVTNFLMLQLVFMVLLFVSQSQNTENAFDWVILVARNLVYLLIARCLHEVCLVAYDSFSNKKLTLSKLAEYSIPGAVLVTSSAVLLASGRRPIEADFPQLYTAYLLCQLLMMAQPPSPTINYGRGMACSFFEGYLSLVLPSDGAHFQNFVDKIRKLEDKQGVVFPAKKLLLVITKSLRCPPDLKEFNEPNRHDLPQIEACSGPEEVRKSVAGVVDRRYRNTAYKISWPSRAHPPVYIIAECATPLHTLYGVLQKQKLYQELCDVDVQQLVDDFCAQLKTILERSPDCRGKCEFVFFDDTPGSGQYLPQVLLDKVEELEPHYRDIIARRAADRADRPETSHILPRTTMDELAKWVPPPDQEEYFANVVAMLDKLYPPDWREWEVYQVTYDDLFGQAITSDTEGLVRFAVPTVSLACAFSKNAPRKFSERKYRMIKRMMIDWPLGRALIYYPRFLMEKVHPEDNGFAKVSAMLKSEFVSRREASAILREDEHSSASSLSSHSSLVADSKRYPQQLLQEMLRSQEYIIKTINEKVFLNSNTVPNVVSPEGVKPSTSVGESDDNANVNAANVLVSDDSSLNCLKQSECHNNKYGESVAESLSNGSKVNGDSLHKVPPEELNAILKKFDSCLELIIDGLKRRSEACRILEGSPAATKKILPSLRESLNTFQDYVCGKRAEFSKLRDMYEPSNEVSKESDDPPPSETHLLS